MRISTRSKYALAALAELANQYKKRVGEPLSAKYISASQNIPLAYLEHLLLKLKKAGVVTVTKGPGGGYQLNKDPKEIKIGDIVRLLDGPIAPVYCLLPLPKSKQCQKIKNCVTRKIWKKLGEKCAEVLDSVTLAELIS